MISMSSFWEKVDKDGPIFTPRGTQCWVWQAGKIKGYGWFHKERAYAHLVSYQLLIGEIPDGCEMDHLCRNPACVNPDHLEAVSKKVNILRGISPQAINARKTHCLHGHEFTPDNIMERSDGGRRCKACYDARLIAMRKGPKTHCRHGHSLEDAYVTGGRRSCRTCHKIYVARYKARKAER